MIESSLKSLGPPKPPKFSSLSSQTVPDLEGTRVCDGPTTGYRNGPNGVVEMMGFKDGVLPAGWFDNPIHCSHCTGSHATTKYVNVMAI